jgi:glycosyltransferase involved in cell wall biosynthesis
MPKTTIVISTNAAWNVVNFRAGLVAALQRSGYRVVALAPPDASVGRMAAMGIEYRPIAMDRKGVSPIADLLLLCRYWTGLRRLRARIFLGYTAKPNIYGSLAAQMLGIKVINNVSGLGTAFIKEGLLTRIVSALYRRAFRRSATVFFQNEEDQALFVAKGLVSVEQAQLMPGSGVDLERFTPAPRAGDDRFVFLMGGRLLWDKGVGEYIAAARIVRRTFPNVRFQLLGFLDAVNRTAVPRATVEQWVAEGIVEYLGETDDVRPFIAAADCVVLPSYREGLPRTLLEAAAMARPVIATDVPGCRHIVADEVNGLLCIVRDPESLARAMVRMIESPQDLRDRWGRAGRERVEREFDERIAVRLYQDAIDDALA